MKPSLEAGFWSKVDLLAEGGCYEWTGKLRPDGYARCWDGEKLSYVHRIAWGIKNGDVPGGLSLDHLCRNRKCVNPDHLEPVHHRTNVLRGASMVAENAKKTHCIRNHPLSGENLRTWTRPNGLIMRQCIACQKAKAREWYERTKK